MFLELSEISPELSNKQIFLPINLTNSLNNG